MPSRPATPTTAFAIITAIVAAAFAPTVEPHRSLRWRLLAAVQEHLGCVRRVRQRRRLLPQGFSGLAGRVRLRCSRLRHALLCRHGARPEAATTAVTTAAAIAAASTIATTSTIASTCTPLRGLVFLPSQARD